MNKTAELWQKVLETEGYKKAKVLNKLQNHLWSNDHLVESIAVTQEIRDLYRELEDTYQWMHYSWVAAFRYSATDRLEAAKELIAEALPVAIGQNDEFYSGALAKLKGDVLSKADDLEGSAVSYAQAIGHFEQLGDWALCGEAHYRLALLNKKRNLPDVALGNFRESIKRYGEANNPAKVLEIRIEMAELLTESNEPMGAINVLTEALPVARFLSDPLAEQKVLRRLGVAHSNRGDADVAALLLKKAAAMKARGPQDQEAALALECLAKHNERFGDPERAKRQRTRVAPVKQALGLTSEESND
jgi:tetratricopeptide (TPR) repeat protein